MLIRKHLYFIWGGHQEETRKLRHRIGKYILYNYV